METRPRNLKSPKELLKLWDEYKESVDNDIYKEQLITNKGDIKTIEKKKPYLRQGFQAWVYRNKGFHIHQYIDNYQDAYKEFLGVVTCIRSEWETDQIGGTLTGQYKAPNLVARLNGISDKKEVDNTHNISDLSINILNTNVPLSDNEKDIEE